MSGQSSSDGLVVIGGRLRAAYDAMGPQLDPPQRFEGGAVIAAFALRPDASLHPRRHAIVVEHDRGGQVTYSTHVVGYGEAGWTGGGGSYDLDLPAAIRDFAEKAIAGV